MNKTLDTPQEILEINSLTEEIERRQVKLSPDVSTYLNERTEKLTAKLMEEQDITEEDMAFVEEVRTWIEMPEEWQEKWPSIEAMQGAEEMKGVTSTDTFEANKRHITLRQWIDLLHVAESSDKEKEWIDETFTFLGDGIINVDVVLWLDGCTSLTHLPENLKLSEGLALRYCTSLTHLPENLEVGGSLALQGCSSLTSLSENLKVGGHLDLRDCTSLTHLSENLEVGEYLYLQGCTSLTHLPDNLKVSGDLDLNLCTSLTHLPDNLKVGGSLNLRGCTSLTYLPKNLEVSGYLRLSGCTSLTHIQENLKVGGELDLNHCASLTYLSENLETGESLVLNGCTSLTHLPDNLKVGGYIYLTKDLKKQVRKGAKRLKKAGNIKGEIQYV